MTYIIERVTGKILDEFMIVKRMSNKSYFILNENSIDYNIFNNKIISITITNSENYENFYRKEDIKDYFCDEINPDFLCNITFNDEETAFYFKLKYCQSIQ